MLQIIAQHPFSFNFVMCLLSYLAAGIFFNAAFMEPGEATYLLIAGIVAACAQGYVRQIIFFLCALLLFLYHIITQGNADILLLAELFLTAIVLYTERKDKSTLLIGITGAAFLCHLFYVQQTPVDVRQHDLSGIFLYMRQITQHGFNGIDFNPWHMYYLFHQPLHFIVAGYLYLTGSALWESTAAAAEGLQYLSLFYVTTASVFAAFILRELRLPQKIFYAGILLFMFNPTLFLFSGYISDDTPAMMWSIIAVYFLFRWYKTEKSLYILAAAAGFGFGVLTKLSVLMAVPAIISLFLCKISTSEGKRTDIFADLCLFVIIAVPLSLGWVIRNHILYDMQFYNIPDTSPWGQNFKYRTLGERIFDFSQISKPFINAPTAVDANIWLAMIKTELFGEWDMSIGNVFIYVPAKLLYLLNIFLKICTVAGILYLLHQAATDKLFRNKPFVWFFIVLYITLWGYSFKYAMDYPYACSTDYRLFAQLILPETAILCLCAARILRSGCRKSSFPIHIWQKAAANFLPVVALLYALLSAFIYVYGL